MNQPLQFDEESHTYTVGGRRLPSVTEIIGTVIERRFNPGDWYLQRGRALHHAIHLMSKGTLDESSVDDRIFWQLQALKKFLKQTGCRVLMSEIPMHSKRYGYAGTADSIMVSHDFSEAYLIDFKGSIEPVVRLQLAAYYMMHQENQSSFPLEAQARLHRALALELKTSGDYKCLWMDKRDLATAEQQFKAVLTVYNFMKQHKLTAEKGAEA